MNVHTAAASHLHQIGKRHSLIKHNFYATTEYSSNKGKLLLSLLLRSLIIELVLLMTIGGVCECQGRLSLDMDFSPHTGMMSTPKAASNELDLGVSINILIKKDCRGEFSLSLQSIDYLTQTLEAFAAQEQLEPAKAAAGNLISTWLTGGQQNVVNQLNAHTIQLGSELDFIYSNFWSLFKPTVEIIIAEIPNTSELDPAFRCKRYQELTTLLRLAESSSLYRIIMDVFAKELFIHCIRRKLLLIELNHVEPSSLVRQFVDIYLDLPGEYSRLLLLTGKKSLTSDALKSMTEMQVNYGLQFDLQKSLEKHGPLEKAATLVFYAGSALSFGISAMPTTGTVVQKFMLECAEYTSKLAPIWADLDTFASSLSSPMSNLVEFSNRVKFAAPSLIYGSVCSQLAQTAL